MGLVEQRALVVPLEPGLSSLRNPAPVISDQTFPGLRRGLARLVEDAGN
jgi:hypothetical protein